MIWAKSPARAPQPLSRASPNPSRTVTRTDALTSAANPLKRAVADVAINGKCQVTSSTRSPKFECAHERQEGRVADRTEL